MAGLYDNEKFFEAYSKMARSEYGLEAAGEWHQFKNLLPDFEGKKVLDLGCGYGWHSKYAAKHYASQVLGIDISEKMIETAKIRNHHKNIEYMVCSLSNYDYPKEEYDCVISNLVLHYIEDLDDIYKKVHKTLKKNGVFVFNIEHPTFTAGINQDWIYDDDKTILHWPIDNYYYPGERTTLFLEHKVTKYHHTLTQILNGLLENDFCIESVIEAMPFNDMMDIPGMKDEMRRPMMLLVKARKK